MASSDAAIAPPVLLDLESDVSDVEDVTFCVTFNVGLFCYQMTSLMISFHTFKAVFQSMLVHCWRLCLAHQTLFQLGHIYLMKVSMYCPKVVQGVLLMMIRLLL